MSCDSTDMVETTFASTVITVLSCDIVSFKSFRLVSFRVVDFRSFVRRFNVDPLIHKELREMYVGSTFVVHKESSFPHRSWS